MDWKKSQIVYQIFIDRFNKGPKFNEKLDSGLYLRDGGKIRNWEETPSRESHGMEFFGGDIDGITDKLDYIKELGANVLYLTPIFLASTNHKYDTHAFKIDPQFGDEKSLKRLFDESHARGMKIVLDGVFNHVGADGIWFNRSRRYGKGGAFNDPKSPFVEFFDFKKWPNQYRSWYDVKLLPELNLKNEKLRKILFEDENSVVKRYIKMGADGWRLDCAHDLGKEINSLIANSVHSVNLDSYVVGEVGSYPLEWLKATKLDGVMNYYFANLVLNGLMGKFKPYIVKRELDRMVEEIGVDALSKSWNMLSSHDSPRLNWTLNGNDQLKRMALTFQIAYPGNPLIYYGEENGMNGGPDPDNRRAMIWDGHQWDWKFREFVIEVMNVKSVEPALKGGRYLKITFDPSSPIVGFGRYNEKPENTLFFFANLSDENVHEDVPIAYSYFMHNVELEPIIGRGEAVARISRIEIEMPPRSAAIFKFKPRFSTYKMYKDIND